MGKRTRGCDQTDSLEWAAGPQQILRYPRLIDRAFQRIKAPSAFRLTIVICEWCNPRWSTDCLSLCIERQSVAL